jgi:phosphatidylglycerophosphate synthase
VDPAGAERSPIVIRAGAAEAAGAAMVVAGLTVIERACKQLRRLHAPVVLATDGACPLPSRLPEGVEVRAAAGEELADLTSSLGGAPIVAADVVRPSNRDVTGGIRVTDAATRQRAEDAIFAELLRGDLGLVARYLNKPISFRVTRHLFCRLPFTPNQVTLGAGLVGVLGALLIATGDRGLGLAGFLLAHVQSVLDGCDGELARVRFQQSAIGEWLDTVVDDALNFLLFAAVGVGCWRASGSTFDLAVGLGSAAAMATYNFVAYRELVRQGEGGEVLKVRWWFARGGNLKGMYDARKISPSRVLMALGRRDFFLFAWLVFAALGLRRLVLLYVAILATANLVAALGQILLVWTRSPTRVTRRDS